MKKILELLEQKVQWIALALGIAYVGYMAWTYLLSAPVTVTLNGKDLAPGEIDGEVLQVAEQLENRMKAKPVLTDLAPPPQYVASFKSTLNYDGKRPDPNLNAMAYLSYGAVRLPPGMELPEMPEMPNIPQAPNPQGAPQIAAPGPVRAPAPLGPLQGPVDKLPALSAPTIDSTLTGLSNVNPKPPNPNATGAAAAVAGVDKSWVSVRFELELDSLAKEWVEKKIPTNTQTTSFLRVMLTRQELLPDGTWGHDTVIGPLPIHNMPAYPAAGPTAAQYEYIRWAKDHTPEILQPPFYPIIKGDRWFIPGEQPPPVNLVADFKPENFLTASDAELNKLTRDQRLAVSAAKEKKRQEENRGRGRGPAPRPAAPRGGGAGNIDLAPIDTGRPISYQAAQPVDVDQIDVDPTVVAPPAAGAPARVTAVAGSGSGKFLYPNGDFDPKAWVAQHPGQPVFGWAHDDTATPGGTYRYKVSYRMKNPVFGNRLAVRQQALMDQFALESPDSSWSNPVDVASTVSFYVQGPPREAAGTVPFHVFSWKGGDLHNKMFNVAAGDIIGGVDGEVDYATGWTVVDFTKDPRPGSTEWLVILMDSKGAIRRRAMSEDMKDQRYQQMKNQAAAPAPAAAAHP